MLINRVNLEEKINNKINTILNNKTVNQEFIDHITKVLSKRGITPAETSLILDKKIPVETMDITFLGVLCDAICIATNEIANLKHLSKHFKIEDFFTEIEVNNINGFKKITNGTSDFTTFTDVIQIEDNKWITKISNKQVKQLFDSNMLGYDPEQQRELIYKKVGKTYVGRIDIDKSQVNEIKNLMISRKYHVTTLTFNMSYGAEYEYDENNKTLRIPGILYVVGGWTRSNATLQATLEDETLEFYQPLMIMSILPEEAAYFAYQENEQRKFKVDTKSLKSLAPASVLVKDIQKKRSLLEGAIGNSSHEGKMFLFNDFVTIIENIYESNDLKNNFNRLEIMKSIINGFENLLFEGIINANQVYDDVELAYFNICIKNAHDKNMDLIELINKNPIEGIIKNIKSRGLKPKIRKIEELIKYE